MGCTQTHCCTQPHVVLKHIVVLNGLYSNTLLWSTSGLEYLRIVEYPSASALVIGFELKQSPVMSERSEHSYVASVCVCVCMCVC
jgi:hypothetical protein